MTPSEIADELYGEDGNCPFCGRDPYHYVDIGVGMERVAVTCCDEGIGYFQHRDPSLTEQVNLRRQAAATIRAQAEALKIATEALEVARMASSEYGVIVPINQALARIKEV